VHTYRVLPSDGLLAVQTQNGVQQRKFRSISDLVHEYKNPQNGLVCGLSNPVGQSLSVPKASASSGEILRFQLQTILFAQSSSSRSITDVQFSVSFQNYQCVYNWPVMFL